MRPGSDRTRPAWLLAVVAVSPFLAASSCDDPPALGHMEIALAPYNQGELGIRSIGLLPTRLEVVHSEALDSDRRVIVLADAFEELTVDVYDDIREIPIGAAPVPVGFVHEIRLITPDGVVRTRLSPEGEILTIPSSTQTGIKAAPENGEPFPIREGAITRILILLNAGEVIHAPGCGFDSAAGRCRASPPPRAERGRETPGGNHVFPDYIMEPNLPARLRQVTGELSPQFAEDELFVMFAPGTDTARAEAVAASVGGSVLRQIPGRPWYTFLLPAGSDESAVADTVQMESDVRVASPNYAIHFLNAPPELDAMTPGLEYNPYWLELNGAISAWDLLAEVRGEAARYGDARPLVAVPHSAPYPGNPDLQHAMYFNPGELLVEVSFRRVCVPDPGGPIVLVDTDLNGDGVIDVNDYDVTSADGSGPRDGVITLADFNAAPYQARINDAINTLTGSTRPPDQVIILEDLLRPNTGSRTTESCGLFENRQDDDGDTRIDDLVGWNFVMGDNWAYTPVPGSPDPSVPRPNISSHGTLVAGVIAAAANERSFLTPRLDLESYVGVAPMTRILPLAMVGSRPGEGGEDLTTEAGFEGWMDRMVEALDYAVQHGAHIINASWSIKCAPAKDGIPQALVCTDADRNAKERRFQAAFDELDSVGLDRVLVVTSGVDFFVDLDRADVQDLPGELHRPNFIMVTASNEMDLLNDTVSFGDETYDLAAPGFRLPWLSAFGRTTDPLGNPISGLLTEGGMLVLGKGTSVAAPQVAGAAAMLMSACPALQGNPVRVRQILIENAECGLPGLSGRVRGACRLDVRGAVQAVLPERGGACP